MTRVMVVNGSEQGAKGNTEALLRPFIEGMREAGAEVEQVYTSRMDIEDCKGEFHCWGKRPGECFQDDEMQDVYPKLRETDIVVLGIPRYIPMPARMQAFINRLCPLIEPVLEFRDGRTSARFHEDVRISKFVLVCATGWWEAGNADLVVRIVRELCADASVEFAGALVRPHAYYIQDEAAADVLEAARRCGRDLVATGRMSEADLAVVSRPLVDRDADIERANRNYLEAKRESGM